MMNYKIEDIQPENAFLIICLIFGIGFLLATPYFQVPDGPVHLLKSIQISEGQILPEKSNNFIGCYPPIPYIVPSIVLCIGNLLNFSLLNLIYYVKLANLLLYILIVYIAIKLTPLHKWVFFLLALMPMTLYEAASLSADSFTMAISFLLIAVFFKFSFDNEKKEVNMQDILILFFLGLMIVLSKQIYIILLLLFFCIPLYKFENRKKMFSIFLSISLPLFLILGVWNYLIQGVYVPISDQVSIQGQISFMLSNPTAIFIAFYKSISLNPLWYLTSFVGYFGWLDTPLPDLSIFIYLIVLILVSLFDKPLEKLRKSGSGKINDIKTGHKEVINLSINLNQKLIILITFFTTFMAIIGLEYIAWTSVGSAIIDGVQGRYFIPIAPLLFVLLYNKKIKLNKRGFNGIVIMFEVMILSISLWLIMNRF